MPSPSSAPADPTLSHPGFEPSVEGFSYADLHDPLRLADLDRLFLDRLRDADPSLAAELTRVRLEPDAFGAVERSSLLVAASRHLSRFLVELFGVEEHHALRRAVAARDQIIFRFKRDVVIRRALKHHATITALDGDAIRARYATLLDGPLAPLLRALDEELAVATLAVELVDPPATDGSDEPAPSIPASVVAEATGVVADLLPADDESPLLSFLEMWIALEHAAPTDGRRSWRSLATPHTLDFADLVPLRDVADMPAGTHRAPDEHLRQRDGFTLTDDGFTDRDILDQVDYCIICHERDRDSCSKGLHEKDGSIRRNPLGIPLHGCPLDEKISEMHSMRREGDAVAALALVTIDNPMCAGTGHRICNDCMKGCIYQKQEPVNIPMAETGVLTDVLRYPYGFEIYALLTRWNPLRFRRPFPLPYNGFNVLVAGLGPAGYTLANWLTNEGFGVVGLDGLKIEPLDARLTGGDGVPPEPIADWYGEMEEELDRRTIIGFGGVAEYGITVRWDKNFLKTLYLILARRPLLRMYGGVRFGGTITADEAWEMGFHHIAVASGAGRPTIVLMKNNLLRGIRQASDFLMGLQLTGAFRRDSLANLQVRLPAIVIGGGLTGFDTATELMAYYPIQVERTLERYETLVDELGEEETLRHLGVEEREILDEMLEHARAIRAERERAAADGTVADIVSLLRSWGGVALVYRKGLVDAPAYRLNHEEVAKGMEEGIFVVENLSPVEAVGDVHGAVEAMIFERQELDADGRWRGSGEMVRLPARSVMIAAGTAPNVVIGREMPGQLALDPKSGSFVPHVVVGDEETSLPEPLEARLRSIERGEVGFFTSYDGGSRRYISYYGDNHPHYAGNVVKAMASAKDGYPHIVALFADEIARLEPQAQAERESAWRELVERLDRSLTATVHEVRRLTPTIVEVVVHAPAAARHFRPGQFYRLQNYETHAPRIDGTPLVMEGIALTGAWVDREQGLLGTIVLEMGTSSRLCAMLRPGEPVVLMGPTGAPTEIPRETDVILCGGGLGNAVLFSIGRAMREAGCRVLYFAGYRSGADLYHQDEVEASADFVVWSTDTGEEIAPRRPQDRYVRGNILEAMVAYASGAAGEQGVPFSRARHLLAIGSDRMMAAITHARHGLLRPYLGEHVAIGSINSPMQCMLKEICAQCLQRHVDPATGEEKGYVFSCFNQDQHLDEVDFHFLNSRLKANAMQERISDLWLEHLLRLAGDDAPARV